MTSLRNKIWIRGIVALAVVASLSVPALALPLDRSEAEGDAVAAAWQVLQDGWSSLLAAVGIDAGGDEPAPLPGVDTTDGSTFSPDPDDGGETLGPMDPNG